MLVGDPGIGKSALLEIAAGEAAADSIRVLRASGAEFERGCLLGAASVAAALRGDLRGQPSGAVLEVALGFAAGPAPNRLAVANATLDVLHRADSLQATLVVIDDLQWLDRAIAESWPSSPAVLRRPARA